MTNQQPPPPPGQYPAPGYPQPGSFGGLPPGYEIRKKKHFYARWWFWLLVVPAFVVILVIIIVVSSVSKAVNDATNKEHTIVYKVTGTIPRADIQYDTFDGTGASHSKSQDGVKLPFTLTEKVKGDFSGFTLLASTPINSSSLPKSGKLACVLLVDGKSVSQDSSSGQANAVTCSGSGYSGNN